MRAAAAARRPRTAARASPGAARSRPPPAARRPRPAEGKQILAIFEEFPQLLEVMREAVAAVERRNKKGKGKRGLLDHASYDLCISWGVNPERCASLDCGGGCGGAGGTGGNGGNGGTAGLVG